MDDDTPVTPPEPSEFVLWRMAVRGTTRDRALFYQHLISVAETYGVEVYDLPEEHPVSDGGDADDQAHPAN